MHFFFKLPEFEAMLKAWLDSDTLQPQVANKLREWTDAGLQEWDISRDAPYFGFEIPGEPGKYFYVWLDAPIGYIASFQNYCERTGHEFDAYWQPGGDTELYHFIGKDIINFHGLFWPAMLQSAGLRTPTAIYAHGFLTVNGTKMSKSRGTFINASSYLEYLDAEYLRYYFAAKLGGSVDDIDLNLEDFVQRVNSDVVGKIVNIASRCAGFLRKGFDNTLDRRLRRAGAGGRFHRPGGCNRRTVRAARVQQGHARDGGPGRPRKPVHRREKALGAGQAGRKRSRGSRCVQCRHQPVPRADDLPQTGTARHGGQGRGFPELLPGLDRTGAPLLDHSLATFKTLMTRIDSKQVEAMVEASKEEARRRRSRPRSRDGNSRNHRIR